MMESRERGLSRPALVRRGLWLLYATLGYNSVEAVVAIGSGILAGSVALIGFGLDSLIEIAASAILIWRLRKEGREDDERIETIERRAELLVGVTFFLLAGYILLEAGSILIQRHEPGESWIGIGLALLSLVVMPILAWAKLRIARRIESRALAAEAMETIVCMYLSFALLLGLVLNAVFGLWWADPVAALAMLPLVLREGWEGVRGEG